MENIRCNSSRQSHSAYSSSAVFEACHHDPAVPSSDDDDECQERVEKEKSHRLRLQSFETFIRNQTLWIQQQEGKEAAKRGERQRIEGLRNAATVKAIAETQITDDKNF